MTSASETAEKTFLPPLKLLLYSDCDMHFNTNSTVHSIAYIDMR